jgi:excinuclease ABC subunit A
MPFMSQRSSIHVVGARQHNLRGIDVSIPRGVLTVITGPSGSGKSSLAFDTLYAEGQRRYVESLSTYARQFLEQMPKPDVERIEGLPPTIAIEQRVTSAGPRSTVATTTEIHDFLRVLFARVGSPTCWKCGREVAKQSTAQVVDAVLAEPEGRRVMILAPLVQGKRGGHKQLLERMVREGFVRVRIDGAIMLLEEVGTLAPGRTHDIDVVVDRLIVKEGMAQRLADSVELATRLSGARVVVAVEVEPERYVDRAYSASLACPDHADVFLDDLTPQLFSFNSPYGACESCHGLGTNMDFDIELIVPDADLSLREGAIAVWRNQGKRLNEVYANLLTQFCEQFGVLPDVAFRNIPDARRRILWHGTSEADAKQYGATFEGVLPNLKRRWESADSASSKQRLHAFMNEASCPACGGSRLGERARCVRIAGRNIADIAAMTVDEARVLLDGLSFEGASAVPAEPLLLGLRDRLHFLCEVGVEYLTLDRSCTSLSGGEWQRIRLATQIGSALAGVCYVLDEPTIGLHARDTQRLVSILTRLADMDNTVVVVEHDPEVMANAAHVIDMGPGAGEKGGQIVAEGSLEEVRASEESITAQFLTGRSRISPPDQRRDTARAGAIELYGVSAHNLKDIDVRFPLGCLTCVTGVSGSGKSTLVNGVLLRVLKRLINGSGPRAGEHTRVVGNDLIDQVVEIDQSPIGRSPRSNPSTYVGVFDLIRKLYAQTREAKIRGYGPARFSFNIKGGRCEQCEGQGTRRISMHFLPDVFVTCDECRGKRYNRETLEIRYRGRTIADVLDMSVTHAVEVFDNFAHIRRRIQALKEVGLGYMALGQPSNTLSGGEAQRVKLASELYRTANGHSLYVLDEPTTGLHFSDVQNLVTLLHRLVDQGATVVVIEHNLDVIKVADWVIDLGPEGGERGGQIVAEGSPEQVAECAASYTGQFLKDHLSLV